MDLTLLRVLKTRERYDKLHKAVPQNVLDTSTYTLLKDFGSYFREFEDETEIKYEPFFLWFRTFAHPKLNPEVRGLYEAQLKKLDEPLDPGLENGLRARLVAAETMSRLEAFVRRYGEGEEIGDVGATLSKLMEDYELDTDRKVKSPWVANPIEELLEDDANDGGFHWRLDFLNQAMRGLQPGDFGIIAGRPDKGKTTFLTDNLTYFASQVDTLYPGENRSILWFNNEGPGKRIVKRLYQSALNAPASDLVARSAAGTLRKDYLAVTGGRDNIIRVCDVHDFWNHEIEDIIRATPPAIIVFDMVDNIKFGGAINNNGQRTDQLLEAMYQWSRVIGVKHDCAVLATSQISAEGENMQYPSLAMLKDSRTGKQGAADFILTLGAQDDYPASRYLGFTKNKLAREGGSRQPRMEVRFDGVRGRYVDPALYSGNDD